MTLDEFQRQINDRYSLRSDSDYEIPAMGLAGEAGEVLEEIKKGLRFERYNYVGLKGDAGLTVYQRRGNIKGELGDALHYIAREAGVLGFTLQEIADENLRKTAPNIKSPIERSRL